MRVYIEKIIENRVSEMAEREKRNIASTTLFPARGQLRQQAGRRTSHALIKLSLVLASFSADPLSEV
jgi:hypothetical protein